MSQTQTLRQYNLVWQSQSLNSSESMPCGGGDIGLNVWVENGDIFFYIARSGTFDENNAMPKLGRVRIKCSPNPFDGEFFRQELNLETGSITISGRSGNHTADVQIWVDVFSPVIHVETESNQSIKLEAIYENWRFEDRLLQENESFGNSYKWAPPPGLKTKKDNVRCQDNAVLFYHRNSGETVFDVSVWQQKMESVKSQMFDPLKDLTFGGKLIGDHFIPAGNTAGEYLSFEYKGWKIKSKSPAKKQSFEVYLHTGQYESKADWDSALDSFVSEYKEKKPTARSETLNWWQNYWKRSFIYIHPEVSSQQTGVDQPRSSTFAKSRTSLPPNIENIHPENKNEASPKWQVGRNYQLWHGSNGYEKGRKYLYN